MAMLLERFKLRASEIMGMRTQRSLFLKSRSSGSPAVSLPKKEVAIIGIVYIRVLMDGFCGEKEKFAAVFCKKFVERVIIGDVEQMPVIETGAL